MLIRNITTFFLETRKFLRIFNGIIVFQLKYTNNPVMVSFAPSVIPCFQLISNTRKTQQNKGFSGYSKSVIYYLFFDVFRHLPELILLVSEPWFKSGGTNGILYAS